jgi:CelD/BcsL family acetyltransferase involved in cellulose biosynthesis
VAERRAAGTDSIKKSGNLLRRLEREIGPLRFEVQVRDPALLRQLLLWRAAKYQSRHPFELLEAILLRFLSLQQDGCRGTLSVLYAGDAIVASHFGLRSRNRWHYWFPAYNAQFEKYSAGIILLLKIAEIACTMGIHTIDLGMGEEDYKRRLMNGSLQIAEGSVQVSSLLSFTRSFRRHAGLVLRRAPVLNSLARRLVGAGETTPASAQVLPS